MTKREKLLLKARRAPGGLSYAELESLAEHAGWTMQRQRGSHRVWRSASGRMVPLQADGSKAKEYQVKQVLKIIEQEHGEGTDE